MRKTERFELRLDPTTINRIDDWQREQPDNPSRAEAMRRLIEMGLGTKGVKIAYNTMKFQILSSALFPETEKVLPNDYVFAWQADVYPINNDYFADVFEPHFRVRREMIEELSEYLNSLWIKERMTSFYQLEDRYRVREGTTEWDRAKLIDACRYMFLGKMFDNKFWKKGILQHPEHPIEAKCITDKFVRNEDITLG